MKCVVTGDERRDTPEEQVRQAIARELMKRYGYRREEMQLELAVQMGSSADKRADLAIFRPDTDLAQRNQQTAYILVECKRADVSNAGFEAAKAQLKSYMAVCHNCHFGLVIAGDRRVVYRDVKKPDGSYDVVEVPDLPVADTPRARFTVVGPSPVFHQSHTTPAPPPIYSPAPPHVTPRQPYIPPSPPRSAHSAGKVPPVLILGILAITLALGGACIAAVSWVSSSDRRSDNADVPSQPSRGDARRCPLLPWDGAVRGWAKPGSLQCTMAGAEEGYYLRVAFNQGAASSRAAVEDAWQRYVNRYLSGASCPPQAKEMIFFDRNGEAGAGILFPRRPPGWDRVMREEPAWRLIDAANQALSTPVCFFPAEEQRRPPGWSR